MNLGLILRFITAQQILVKITNSDPSCLVSRLGPAGAFEPYVYVLYEPNFGTRAFKPNLAPAPANTISSGSKLFWDIYFKLWLVSGSEIIRLKLY